MEQEIIEEDVAQFSPGDLFGIGMGIVVLIIGISFGLDVMEDTQADLTENGTAYNATGDGIEAVAKIPEKMGIYVTILMAAAIIGLLTRYLWNKGAM